MNKITCYRCHKELDLTAGSKISRNEECPHCASYLHCCFMCQFYDKNAYNECRETNADRIVEKDKNNFCDYFVFKGGSDGGSSKDDILAKANSIFKF